MSKGDIFLKIDSQRGGVIKGESNDSAHPNEIDVVSWSWGMRAGGAMGGAGAAGRTAMDAITISKQVDSASTALMSVMRSNDLIKKAVLTVRKAGTVPIEYFIVTIEQARITSYDVGTAPGAEHLMDEKITISFQKISIDYYPQDATGGRKGGSNFSADVASNA